MNRSSGACGLGSPWKGIASHWYHQAPSDCCLWCLKTKWTPRSLFCVLRAFPKRNCWEADCRPAGEGGSCRGKMLLCWGCNWSTNIFSSWVSSAKTGFMWMPGSRFSLQNSALEQHDYSLLTLPASGHNVMPDRCTFVAITSSQVNQKSNQFWCWKSQ